MAYSSNKSEVSEEMSYHKKKCFYAYPVHILRIRIIFLIESNDLLFAD